MALVAAFSVHKCRFAVTEPGVQISPTIRTFLRGSTTPSRRVGIRQRRGPTPPGPPSAPRRSAERRIAALSIYRMAVGAQRMAVVANAVDSPLMKAIVRAVARRWRRHIQIYGW